MLLKILRFIFLFSLSSSSSSCSFSEPKNRVALARRYVKEKGRWSINDQFVMFSYCCRCCWRWSYRCLKFFMALNKANNKSQKNKIKEMKSSLKRIRLICKSVKKTSQKKGEQKWINGSERFIDGESFKKNFYLKSAGLYSTNMCDIHIYISTYRWCHVERGLLKLFSEIGILSDLGAFF